jgi:uncharacterized protein (UPF0276 family)
VHLKDAILSKRSDLWFEIHPENFVANPHACELLFELRQRHPIAVHTIGISVGSFAGVDDHYLRRLAHLVELLDPPFVSGHLAWTTFEDQFLADLLPLPYTEETLSIVSENVRVVQERLDRPYVVENPSSYLALEHSTMSEQEFLLRLTESTNCGLLCDISNLYITCANYGLDPYTCLERLPASHIWEFHIGGYTEESIRLSDGTRKEVLVDTHDSQISQEVWALFFHAVRRVGRVPTIIEWDRRLPPFERLLAEADYADGVAQGTAHA